jgi:hypothetical protein
MWDATKKMKYEASGQSFNISNYGYGNDKDKYKYRIKQGLKTGDLEYAMAEMGAYAEYLRVEEGKDSAGIKKSLTSLLKSQSIFYGLDKTEKKNFISGLTPKQQEMLLIGLQYEQQIAQQFGIRL